MIKKSWDWRCWTWVYFASIILIQLKIISYMNCILQSLFNSPNFPFYLLSYSLGDPFIKSFSDLCSAKQNAYTMNSESSNIMVSKSEMKKFTESFFENIKTELKKGKQEDAHEFLLNLLSVLPLNQFNFKSNTSKKWVKCKHEMFTVENYLIYLILGSKIYKCKMP